MKLTLLISLWNLAMFAIACGAGHADFYSQPADPCVKKKGPEVCYTEDGELTCHQGGR